jgi:hypothetical protein
MGKFDDNKYVQQMRHVFTQETPEQKQQREHWQAAQAHIEQIKALREKSQLDAYIEQNKADMQANVYVAHISAAIKEMKDKLK